MGKTAVVGVSTHAFLPVVAQLRLADVLAVRSRVNHFLVVGTTFDWGY